MASLPKYLMISRTNINIYVFLASINTRSLNNAAKELTNEHFSKRRRLRAMGARAQIASDNGERSIDMLQTRIDDTLSTLRPTDLHAASISGIVIGKRTCAAGVEDSGKKASGGPTVFGILTPVPKYDKRLMRFVALGIVMIT